jgi:hypothetical protein
MNSVPASASRLAVLVVDDIDIPRRVLRASADRGT